MLHQEKNLAIENEDYDMAKNCKIQIENVMQVAYQVGEPEQ